MGLTSSHRAPDTTHTSYSLLTLVWRNRKTLWDILIKDAAHVMAEGVYKACIHFEIRDVAREWGASVSHGVLMVGAG